MNKTVNLFEYCESDSPFSFDETHEFKQFLDKVWQRYKEEKPKYFREDIKNFCVNTNHQPFIAFDEDKIKSKNYVGFIKFKDIELNLYPKICKNCNITKTNEMLQLWIQYSNNLILPKIDTSLSCCNESFIEILIYLFAKYTSDLLSVSIYQHYEEISEETKFLKGKLNFNEYIKNITNCKRHIFNCTYDSFEINNKFNKIIKYVSKNLLNVSKNDKTKQYLSNIISTFDEVDDKICTVDDCDSIYINRFMGDFQIVLDYCKMFLQNSISFNEFGEYNNFAFLLKTEKLFEDFISNYSKEKFKTITIETQQPHSLDADKIFYIKPDIIIKDKDKITKIIDIKYKDIENYDDISNADIYQIITYATKLNCDNVVLLYPDYSVNENIEKIIEPVKISLESLNRIIKLSFKFVNCKSEENLNASLKDIF